MINNEYYTTIHSTIHHSFQGTQALVYLLDFMVIVALSYKNAITFYFQLTRPLVVWVGVPLVCVVV